jgi:trigger factor
MPLYEYEHMEEWAVVQRHVADEITLLCDHHHREKTNKLLPKAMVREANADPYNFRKNVKKPYTFHFSGKEAEIFIGGNRFTCEDHGYGTILVPISIDDVALVGFILTDGHLLLNLAVFDEFNALVLQIKNNQLFYANIPWDIQLVGTRLTIREAHRKVLLEIDFTPPNSISISRGRFLRNGVEVLVRPDGVLVTNNSILIRGCHAHNCGAGLMLGPHTNNMSGMFYLEQIPRYLGDRKAALNFEKECLARVQQDVERE